MRPTGGRRTRGHGHGDWYDNGDVAAVTFSDEERLFDEPRIVAGTRITHLVNDRLR